VTFIGSTLWTDFTSVGHGHVKAKMAEAAGRNGLADYKRIKRWSTADPTKHKRFRPEDSMAAHRTSRAFIEGELAKGPSAPTVVVTHHAPLADSLDRRYGGTLDFCFASNLRTTFQHDQAPDVWMHGHIHQARDYHCGRTRVVANPRGYKFELDEVANGFLPDLVIEITTGERLPKP
jgi:hypothetical protein